MSEILSQFFLFVSDVPPVSIIGFTRTDGTGTYGLEEYYNDVLSGVNGRQYGYIDGDDNLQRTLDLMDRPGTLICFDFQADVLRRYCGSRVRFQTIDFTKFEGRLFP